jgi:type II secretory pathway component PulF
MRFIFKAKDKKGQLKEGIVDAANQEGAIDFLQKNDLFPISVTEEKKKDAISSSLVKLYERVTPKELVVFFRQLAVMVEAKVPILSSLKAIQEQTTNKYMSVVVSQMINDIQDGMAFSDAMKKHRDVFSVMAINMVKSGEASGNLRKSIDYVANSIERNYNLMTKVRAAMIYPAIVLIAFFIIGFIVISFVVPQLTVVIKDLGVEVPWYTAMVISVGDFMNQYWWAIAIVILGIILGFVYYLKSSQGRMEWDRMKPRLPLVGEIYVDLYVARFADNLSVLLTSGIPIITALKITGSIINNYVYQEIFERAAEEVKNGGYMSNVFLRTYRIPPIVSQMIKIGEESGQVDTVLAHIAKFYEDETETKARSLSTIIEPVLMILVGIAVGFLAFSVLMPIYDIAGKIK